jgi:sugar diacid utilization regulator
VIKQDYVERMIQQLVEALARLLKLREAGSHGEALAVVRSTCEEVFGVEYETLVGVDAASAASVLGTPEKVRRFAELVRAEAEVLEAAGEHGLAVRRRTFAAALEHGL